MNDKIYVYASGKLGDSCVNTEVFWTFHEAKEKAEKDCRELSEKPGTEVVVNDNDEWLVYDASADASYFGQITDNCLPMEKLCPGERINLLNRCEEPYLFEDAAAVFCERIGWREPADDELNVEIDEDVNANFMENYGFSVQEAMDKDSEHYLIGRMVERFRDIRDWQTADYDAMRAAVREILEEVKGDF